MVDEMMLVGMAAKALLLVLVPVDFKEPGVVFVVLLLSGPIVVLVLFVPPSAPDVLSDDGRLGAPEMFGSGPSGRVVDGGIGGVRGVPVLED